MLILKVIYEAIRQAMDSMLGNKLRTFLSLLGIMIGIFCIIAVKSAVDSLEDNIVSGFNELGSDVVYIEKMPWDEDPGANWWKYNKRPEPSYEDYEAIKRKSKKASGASFNVFTGGRTIKFNSSSVSNAFIMGTSTEYQRIQGIKVEQGRAFTTKEHLSGSNKTVLGAKVAKELFGALEPIGKEVKLFGQKYDVIGVLKEEGDNPFNFINYDDVIWVPLMNAKKHVNIGKGSPIGKMLNVKAKDGIELSELKGELTGILRANRRLSPVVDDNFSINELSMLSNVLDSVFGAVNVAGFLIGIFALIVGMFSVANIMFVSVKERTSIIGIKKAIGAKSYVILLEFLIESVILCLIGGAMGIVLVWLMLKAASAATPIDMSLSVFNVTLGVICSVLVGVISGVLPALQASSMDPVEAIRS